MTKTIIQENQIVQEQFKIVENKQIGDVESVMQYQKFQECDVRNRNNRVYPKEQVVREINKLKPKIEKRQLLGELDHPEGNDIDRIQTVKLTNVSHVITNLEIKGNDVYGTIETLQTPNGIILKNLLKSNVELGVSLRQLGSVEERYSGDEYYYYVKPEDFELITYDIVYEPGFESQKVKIIKESLEEMLDYNNFFDSSFEKDVYTKFYMQLKKHLKSSR